MLFFVNPIIMTLIGYLSVTAYFGCVESPHPFKAFCTPGLLDRTRATST
jgi:hypothetical protein